MNTHRRRPRILSVLAHLLFWGLNLPLAIVILYWSISYLFASHESLVLADLTDTFPVDVIATLFIFFSMPVLSVLIVLITRSYRKPVRLLQILFGVELPVMAFTLGRLIFLKTLTPVNVLFLSTAAISITAYVLYVIKKPFRHPILQTIHLLAHQAAVVVGVYASLLMFFFLPIVVAMVVQVVQSMFKYGFPEFRYYDNIGQIILAIITFTAFSSLFLSLISSPFIGLFMYWRATNRLSRVLQKHIDQRFPRMSKWVFSLAYACIVIVLTYQGSLLSFYGQMKSFESMTNFEERSIIAARILKRKGFIEHRLVDTYLSNYRYLTDSEMTLLQQAYQDQLKLDQPVAKRIQNWFTMVAFPFVYNGKFTEDVKQAEKYYELMFDEPIQIAQSQKVRQTLATWFTFGNDSLKSSVLDREDEDVLLVQRTVNAVPDSTNQFATVSIEEEYENMTNSEQEVFYIFSLPQDSVITELQLGPDLQLGKEQLDTIAQFQPEPTVSPAPSTTTVVPTPIVKTDQGEIAAKGAANQVFENQYRRRIDPAILEQVGPVQYKLRVYPIPVKEENLNEWQRERLTEPVRNQKMRFSYVTALNPSGKAALPTITEKRNLFSRSNTFTYNSPTQQVAQLTADTISVPVLSTTESTCGTQATQYVNNTQLMLFVPHAVNHWLANDNIRFDCGTGFTDAELTVKNKRIGILADSSYSMGVQDWEEYLTNELPLDVLLGTNAVDLYFFNDSVSKPISLNQERTNPKIWDQVAFGKTDRLKALKAVEGKYDVVLMFTDGSEADNPDDNSAPHIAQPTYLIHKGGKVPKLPDSLTYYLQANEARVVSSGKEALQNFAVYQSVKRNHANASFILVGEAGSWISLTANESQIISGVSAITLSSTEPIAKIATHRMIESEMRKAAHNLHQLSFLDSLNTMAQQSGIVTPFSSFIVLVTDQQKEQLRQASLQEGRYVVNYDLGEEPLVEPTSGGFLGTSAVPEPHEWILLISGFGLVLFLGRDRVKALLAKHHA